jgi:predicted PurR-regulated permease PerM
MRNEHASGTVLLLLMSASFLYLSYLLFRPYATPIIFAIVIAVLFHPLHGFTRRKLVRNKNVAALASTAVTMLAAAVPLIVLAFAVRNELLDLYRAALTGPSGTPLAHTTAILQRAANWATHSVGLPQVDIHTLLIRSLGGASSSLIALGGSIVGNVVSWIVDAVIAAVVLFFLFRDGQTWLARVVSVLPLSRERVADLQARISSTIVANFYGSIAVGAAQGTLTGLVFWILGIQSPALWGTVAAFVSLLPIVGSATVWAPASLILLLNGHVIQGIILLALGICLIGIIDNVVRPLIMSGSLQLHPICVLFALIGGMEVFGPIGLFVGPVVLSVTAALLPMVAEDLQPLLSRSAAR